MKPFINLEGQRFLIVGANFGIGHATALLAHQCGASVAVTRLPSLSFEPLPEDVAVFDCDVTSPQSCEQAVSSAVRHLGGLDAVILAAGVFEHRGVHETTDEDWRRVMSINLDGPFHMARAVQPVFEAAKAGSLVLFSSQIGIVGHGRATAYAASKAGVNGLARTLAIEFAPFGARVNAVAPGPIETPMTAVARADPTRSANLVAAIPLKRFGTANEVASSALFLASPAAGFITGHVLTVDGGVTAI